MKEKIKFKDLSGWMKFAIVGGMIYMVSFIFGFMIGFAGY